MPIRFALPVAALATMTLPIGAAPDPLAPHRWRDRLLVVVAPDAGGPAAEQRRLYEASRAGNRERDLVWIDGTGDTAAAHALRRRFDIPAGAFRAILVGKDGSAKLSSADPIPAARLFEEIDAMPMRRDEARRSTP